MYFDQKKADRAVNFIQALKHTKGAFHGKPFLLLDWQKKIISDIYGSMRDEGYRQYSHVYIEIAKKQGKALGKNTLIPSKCGWISMGDLKVGDEIFDEQGNICHVLAKSEIIDDEQCYRITFRDGSYIDAGERHIWDVDYIYGKPVNKQWTTGEIYRRTIKHHERHRGEVEEKRSIVRIRIAKPLQCPDAELPVDPYLYGYWLGNGTAKSSEITVRDADEDELLKNIPYEIKGRYKQPGSVRIWIPALKPVLVDSFRDKAIRPEYLRASEEQRWALLQGLMDSDGCIGTRKAQSIYVTTIKQLAEGIRELLWSLGIKNAMTEGPSTRYGKPTGETLYTIRFTTFDDQPTSRLHRKIERKRERVKETRSCFHYIDCIEPLPYKVEMQCIQVDSPSRLYLAGPSMVPTHNSELGAALALNQLVNDDEWNAEVYSCASDRGQASLVFDVAADMVDQSPALKKRIKVVLSTKRMVYLPTGSVYRVLSSEVGSKHGYNVSACIFDELHAQPTRDLYDVMTKGSGDARLQPLFIFLTTAGNDTNSICYEVHQKAADIIAGRKSDPKFYPVIFGLDESDDWTDEKNWYKANPSLGVTVSIDKVRDAFRDAQQNPAEENIFRQLRLNQWVKQKVRWMPMEKWEACGQVPIDPDALVGRPCYAGLDLSSTSDITAFVLVFPPEDPESDEPYQVLPFFWLPEETLGLRVKRDHVMYDKWEGEGYIMTTEGSVVHYGYIRQFINDLYTRYNIREIAYDRWNASMMVQSLEEDGMTMVPFGQGFRDMSPPTKELMRMVLDKKIAHGNHPVLNWMMDNAYVKTDPAGNIKIDKEKSTEKVDGAIALVMALDRASRNNGPATSVYDERDLIIL